VNFFKECIKATQDILDGKDYKDFEKAYNSHQNIIILGNGGSNAVASHIAQDMTKRGGKRALSFSDPSMLTCFMNDYGVDDAYAKFLEFYAGSDTLVILISSSGKSQNILEAVKYCIKNNIDFGVLTAFDPNNPVRISSVKSKFNYYIPTNSYGVAECIHQVFLHGIVECE
jgi:D-sedoheptulose 7-phosphate isomerase